MGLKKIVVNVGFKLLGKGLVSCSKIEDAVKEELKRRQIRCLVVWECTIKNAQKKNGNSPELVKAIIEFLNSNLMYQEL